MVSENPPEIEILERSPAQIFARYGPLLIGCWRDRSSVDQLRVLVPHHHEQHRRYPNGYLSLTILEHGIPLERNQEMVEYGRTTRAEFGSSIVRQCYVIPHAGFTGTMLRLMVNNVMRLVPSSQLRIYQTLPEVWSWLGNGPVAIPEQARLERELPAALGLRESSVRSSIRRREPDAVE